MSGIAHSRIAGLTLSLAMLLAASSCDVYREDNENDVGTTYPPPAAAPAPPAATSVVGGGTVTVRSGQTLFGIARASGVPIRALIDANNLTPPYLLKIGQTLTVPRVRVYAVQPGDTLSTIATATGVDTPTLTRFNHLDPPYVLAAGSTLVLPAEPGTRLAAPVAVAPAPRDHPQAVGGAPIQTETLPPPPATNPAKTAAPAVRPAPPAAEPVPVPPAPPERPVAAASPKPGAQPVSIDNAQLPPPMPLAPPAAGPPPASQPQSVKPPPPLPPPAAPPPAPTIAATPLPEPPPPAKTPPAAAAQTGGGAPAEAAASADVARHRPPSAPLFYWPVRGKILSTFGQTAGGTQNDGINVAAAEGSEIDAAESGVVAYAGSELKGYGNLMLIQHADGWVTAYAHAKDLLVKKGDHVRRGQAIAEVGTTGGVDRPQVHFELRRGTKAVDPLDHLPPLGG